MSTNAFMAVCGGLVVLGLLLPLWQLAVVGVALMALWGRWFIAFVIGLVADVVWGVPLGVLHYVYFPFVLVALVAALVRLVAGKYVIDRNLPERL